MKKSTLTLNIVYSGPDATEDNIRQVLQAMVETAADRGLLTDNLNVIVEESDFEITFPKKHKK